MIQSFATLLDILNKYGPGAVIIALFVWFILIIIDEDLSARWRARFFRVIFFITGKSEAEKKYIENNACSQINFARRKMPFGKEHLPKAIKIEWQGGSEQRISNIQENEIIIRLDPTRLQEKNIVIIADALVKQTALVGIRYLLNNSLENSIDLNLIKNLLIEVDNRRVLDWFFKNEYQTAIANNEDIKQWNTKIVEMDERGLFTRLLLVELDDFSKRISGRTPTREMTQEIVGLIGFIHKIATKSYGQEVPLEYVSRNIRFGVMLVADTSRILSEGIQKYLSAFAYKMKQQLTSIYVSQFDKELLGATDPEAYKEFVELTQSLDREIQQSFIIRKDFELGYTCIDTFGNKRKVKLTRYIPEYRNNEPDMKRNYQTV